MMVCCKALALAAIVCVSIAVRAIRVERHQVLATIEPLGEAPITLRLKPGPLGVRLDLETGEVIVVHDGHGKDAGLKSGMKIRKLDGSDYTQDLLLEKKEGDEEYTVVLDGPTTATPGAPQTTKASPKSRQWRRNK